MIQSFVTQQVAAYVTELLSWQLSPELKFHNKKHTEEVVATATLIGQASNLNEQELETLQIAAWFHDTGYCYRYNDHEDDSIAVASNHLHYLGCNDQLIGQVQSIITATRMPQKPASHLEEIMCDADLAHLASEHYKSYSERLRAEWATFLGNHYTEEEWKKLNILFLKSHKFFTVVGQTLFEEKKQANLQKLHS